RSCRAPRRTRWVGCDWRDESAPWGLRGRRAASRNNARSPRNRLPPAAEAAWEAPACSRRSRLRRAKWPAPARTVASQSPPAECDDRGRQRYDDPQRERPDIRGRRRCGWVAGTRHAAVDRNAFARGHVEEAVDVRRIEEQQRIELRLAEDPALVGDQHAEQR